MTLEKSYILIIDDDLELIEILTEYLSSEGFDVAVSTDGEKALEKLAASSFDLVILDVMLPSINDFDVLRKLRQSHVMPVVMLSARGEEIDRIVGLELGADDYIAKPFSPRELLARLKAVLRRTSDLQGRPVVTGSRGFSFLGWHLDTLTGVVLDPDGTHVTITGAELELLKVFCERPGRVLAREQLIELTRGGASSSSERSVDILVSRLRRKITPKASTADLIRTVRSGGYVFTAAVTSEA